MLAPCGPQVPASPNAAPWERARAETVDALGKVVASGSIEDPSWSDARVLREVTPEAVVALREGSDRRIVTFGSASLAQRPTQLGLTDGVHVLVHPVLLGAGKSLFGPLDGRLRPERVRAEPFRSGVTLLVYRAAR